MSWINSSCIGNTHTYNFTKRREHDRLSVLQEQAPVSTSHSPPLEGDTLAITALSSLRFTYRDITQPFPSRCSRIHYAEGNNGFITHKPIDMKANSQRKKMTTHY